MKLQTMSKTASGPHAKSAHEMTEYPSCIPSKGACGLGITEKPTMAKLKTTGGIHRPKTSFNN
jgi:hypothetical protein